MEVLSVGILAFNCYVSYLVMGPRILLYGKDYGEYMLGWSDQDPSLYLFSTSSKCKVPSFGMGGKNKTTDGLCMLPKMLMIEKVYLILWVYIWILAFVNIISLVISCVQCNWFVRAFSLSIGSTNTFNKAYNVVKRISYSDWMVMTFVKANTESLLFDQFLTNYYEEIARKKSKRNSLSV